MGKFLIHSLRHTFATRLGESGADAFTIMRLLGDSSIKASQRYVLPTVGMVENAQQDVEDLMLGVVTNAREKVVTKGVTEVSSRSLNSLE